VRLATVVGTLGWDMQQVILTFANLSTMRLDALGLSVEEVKNKQKELMEQGMSTAAAFKEAVIQAGEARCRAWAERGGRWVVSHYSGLMGAPFLTIVFPESGRVQPQKDDVIWRPWMGQNPTPWSDFYAATHPPIPEGWGVVKEWELRLDNVIHNGGSAFLIKSDNHNGLWHSGDGYFCKVRRTLPAIPAGWEAVGEWEHRADGDTVMFGSTTDGEMLLHESGSIEAIRPSAGWFRRVRRILPPADWGDVPRGVELNPDKGAVMLVTSDGHAVTHGIVWFAQGVWRSAKTMEHDAQRADSLPAAIVALTGRRK
jgi:uncharacterized protein YbdZ (MbtH family)